MKILGMWRANERKTDVIVLNSGKCIEAWPTSVFVYDSEQAARDVHITHMGGRGEPTEFRPAIDAGKYVCAQCGSFSLIDQDADILDNGTTLTCEHCKEPTVVDLGTPEYRKKLFEDAGRHLPGGKKGGGC